ncbi:hypothetical protein D9611_001005 [Ephemerocybe angulata]|uniref:Uncharacterized protein n=1 Tax=Ephemerocybe angulata TaxID=980116 RepID=A0A8H5BQN0_9AGAR|nr:hypothetical protein D9611_001005 [Tulosesus angulatus]
MLLAGNGNPQSSREALVSGNATGGTLENAEYPSVLEGTPRLKLNLWDTSGFAESDTGNVTAAHASQNMSKLLKETLKGRVGLLVFCIKGRPFRPIIKQLYDEVFNKTCQRNAPIILVVTGLENAMEREIWWDDNQMDFRRNNMTFKAHACITATRGRVIQEDSVPRRCVFDREYEESIEMVQTAIRQGLFDKGEGTQRSQLVSLPETKPLFHQDSKKKRCGFGPFSIASLLWRKRSADQRSASVKAAGCMGSV